MITKLQHPASLAALSLLLSLALGVGLCWRAADPLIAEILAAREKKLASKKDKGWDFWTIEIENLSNELKEERARLRKQAELLEQRAGRLSAEEKELERIRTEVEKLRQEIAAKVIEISADEAKNIRVLAQTYTSLTPRAAVAILREMDDTTAVKILSLMKPDVVGPIFEEMSHTSTSDGSLARRVAVLSDKLRLMKAARPANQS